ncbi:MAG TPA: response regulator [Tepidisphaeraceae bacterium]|jgi:CheY-like chemotaxis protein
MVSQVLPIFAETKLADPTVWIVEDEHISRRAMSVLLSASGYRTQAFPAAEDAIRLAEHGGRMPRFALVDLDLPGMSGLEFIARLERLDPRVFPILVTATDEETLASRLHLHYRSLAYLRKPVNFEMLLKLLEEHQQADQDASIHPELMAGAQSPKSSSR